MMPATTVISLQTTYMMALSIIEGKKAQDADDYGVTMGTKDEGDYDLWDE